MAVEQTPVTNPLTAEQRSAQDPATRTVQLAIAALIEALQPLTNAQLRATAVDVEDSGERDYTPGRVPKLIVPADGLGPHILYDNRTQESGGAPDINGNYGNGQGFRLRRIYAVPVTRSSEEPPVITLKVVSGAGTLLRVLDITAANSERSYFACPADARVVAELDIAARVPCRLTIEELTAP